jgi:hypothetical protein
LQLTKLQLSPALVKSEQLTNLQLSPLLVKLLQFTKEHPSSVQAKPDALMRLRGMDEARGENKHKSVPILWILLFLIRVKTTISFF